MIAAMRELSGTGEVKDVDGLERCVSFIILYILYTQYPSYIWKSTTPLSLLSIQGASCNTHRERKVAGNDLQASLQR